MFDTKFVDKIKTRILCSVTFSPKILPFVRHWKNVVQPEATDDNTRRSCALHAG